MGSTHLVVDGSNIATEGRTAPSLAQLDEAVRAFIDLRSYEQVIVVVDATFGRRIDPSEVGVFEEAVVANEIVTPPAGTIGRGDAFILEVARRADADVLSNDSFQELHAEHTWLFESGRLWGGKPVPAVGWVFVARAPVRGVTSRKVTDAAKKAKKAAEKAAEQIAGTIIDKGADKGGGRAVGKATGKTAGKASGKAAGKAAGKPADASGGSATARTRGGGKAGAPSQAKAEAAPVARSGARGGEEPAKGRGRRGRGEQSGAGAEAGRADNARDDRSRADKARPYSNEHLVYASFVVDHPVGSNVTGTVDRFSSHGAYVRLGAALGYVPLKSLGNPPPRSAREVLTVGEDRKFRITRFDPTTRGIDVVPDDLDASLTSAAPTRGRQAVAASVAAGSPAPDAEEAPVSPVAKRAAKKATAKKATAKKATAKKATAKKSAAKKAPARKSTAKKATPRKSAAKKAPARKAPAKKASPRKALATAKRSVAKKATATKAAAKKALAKKAPAKKKAPARKAPAKKSVAKRR